MDIKLGGFILCLSNVAVKRGKRGCKEWSTLVYLTLFERRANDLNPNREKS